MLTNCQTDVFRTLEINPRQQFKEHLSKNNDCVAARRVSFGGVITFLISISHLLLLLISAVALKIKSPQWHWKSTVEHNEARVIGEAEWVWRSNNNPFSETCHYLASLVASWNILFTKLVFIWHDWELSQYEWPLPRGICWKQPMAIF